MTEPKSRLIDSLDLPRELRTLDTAALRRVAEEVRAEIIHTVTRNGGHLGASLGVVEIAIALHAELNTPDDVIIWDVGHQAYAHKLLTGRLKEFSSIRTYGGLSGFPSREESPFDVFGTGHASTSISAAVGMAEAWRRTQGSGSSRARRVVAVIGDGALTGGVAYEALNHAGHLKTPILVILNDNAMAIDKNVGAISAYLSRLRTEPTLYKLRRDLERRLQRLPGVGDLVTVLGTQLKDSLKAALTPGMLFEELGFTYVGLVDGHDIDELRSNIRRCLAMGGPVLLHCRTIKGKGYPPAEKHPGRYHGIPAFSASTGESDEADEPTTFTRAFGEAMVELASRDERVVGITAAMAVGTGLDLLKERMPDRFFDVGIAEQHAVVMAAGLAAAGKRPVVAIYSTFLQRAFDHIIHDVCLQRLPVVFAVDRAGLVGADGPTHHGAFDLSYLRFVPGLTIFVPKDEAELQRLLATALHLEGPSVIRYPRCPGVGAPICRPIEPLEGPWVEVLREGKDLLFLAVGPIVYNVLTAAELLRASGIEATVASVRQVRPIDASAVIDLVVNHPAVITVEDNTVIGGFGSLILELMADAGICRRVARAGLPDRFVAHGPVEVLQREIGLSPEGLADRALRLLS
ncbi:MAG: 1-deoxy-D-xylulose-5-phosphate synthase [Thermoleophilia bacterium]|nr:1-deoxy-D-xylulose-5-phosphate synthase [Thermoleophilia bacterium]